MVKFRLYNLFILLTVLCCGCGDAPENTPALPPATQFEQIAQSLNEIPEIHIDYCQTTTMTCGSNTFTYNDQKEILWDTATGHYHASGILDYGAHKIYYSELFTDATLYLTVNGGYFSGDHSGMNLPLPKPNMFTDYTISTQADAITIHFQDNKGSFWKMPEGAKVLNAQGTLTKSDSCLYTINYTISYQTKMTTFDTTVEILYDTATEEIPSPDKNAYTPVSHVLAPLKLEKAYGLLQQATHLSSTATQEINSTANNSEYRKQISLSRQNEQGTIYAETALVNFSQPDAPIITTQKEDFQNGRYSITADSQQPKNQPVEKHVFFNYFTQLLSKNILAAKYVTSASQIDNTSKISFRVNHELSETLYNEMSQLLFRSEAFGNTQTEPHPEHSINYTITIDPINGLPLSIQFDYSSIHTISDISYPLTAKYEQTVIYE